MNDSQNSDRKLDELLGRLREPVPPEHLEGAWRIIDSKLEWRKPMNPLAFTLPGKHPRLVAALATAAMLLFALVIGVSYAPMRGPDLGSFFGSRGEARSSVNGVLMVAPGEGYTRRAGRLGEHWDTSGMDKETARGQEDAISDIPLGGQGVSGSIGVGGGGAAGMYGFRDGSPRKALDRSEKGKDLALDKARTDYQAAEEALQRSEQVWKSAKEQSREGRAGESRKMPPPAPATKPAPSNRPGGQSGQAGRDRDTAGALADPTTEPKPAQTAQKIIKTAVLEIEIDKFADANRKVDELVKRHGAFYADSKTSQNADGTSGGYYVIRVPQNNFESLYAELKNLGRVKVENAKGEDVTAQYTDLDARIRNLEHMEQRLLALLAEKKKGDKLSEVLEIERELGKRREEIEQSKGQMRVLSDKISLSTIYLTVAERGRTVPAANFSVEVKDAAAADRAIDPLLAGLGGQLASRQSSKRHDGTLQVQLSVKVPMPRFGDLVNGIRALGHIERENVEGFNPAAINTDPGAKDVMSVVALVLYEPLSQKPGGVANIEVRSLDEAARAIGALLERVGGKLVSRNEVRDASGRSANATYKVSVARKNFRDLVAGLDPMVGRVENKNLVGVDVTTVDGPAAEVHCELTLTVFERPRETPSADATVTVTDLGGAADAVRALLATVDGQVVSHTEQRVPGGTSTALFVLRCTQGKFTSLLAGLEVIGRVDGKSVQGMDLQPVEGTAASALCQLTLRIQEKVPSAALGIEVRDAAEATARIHAAIKQAGGRTERVDRQKSPTGASTDTWHLRIPVRDFESFVLAMEKVGEVKAHNVQGLGEGAKAASSEKALADVRLTVVRPDSVTSAPEGTFRGTIGAAFTTLWYVLAVLLYGLIVIVPAVVLITLVVKVLVWALRPRRPAPAVTSVEAPRNPEQK